MINLDSEQHTYGSIAAHKLGPLDQVLLLIPDYMEWELGVTAIPPVAGDEYTSNEAKTAKYVRQALVDLLLGYPTSPYFKLEHLIGEMWFHTKMGSRYLLSSDYINICTQNNVIPPLNADEWLSFCRSGSLSKISPDYIVSERQKEWTRRPGAALHGAYHFYLLPHYSNPDVLPYMDNTTIILWAERGQEYACLNCVGTETQFMFIDIPSPGGALCMNPTTLINALDAHHVRVVCISDYTWISSHKHSQSGQSPPSNTPFYDINLTDPKYKHINYTHAQYITGNIDNGLNLELLDAVNAALGTGIRPERYGPDSGNGDVYHRIALYILDSILERWPVMKLYKKEWNEPGKYTWDVPYGVYTIRATVVGGGSGGRGGGCLHGGGGGKSGQEMYGSYTLDWDAASEETVTHVANITVGKGGDGGNGSPRQNTGRYCNSKKGEDSSFNVNRILTIDESGGRGSTIVIEGEVLANGGQPAEYLRVPSDTKLPLKYIEGTNINNRHGLDGEEGYIKNVNILNIKSETGVNTANDEDGCNSKDIVGRQSMKEGGIGGYGGEGYGAGGGGGAGSEASKEYNCQKCTESGGSGGKGKSGLVRLQCYATTAAQLDE